MKRCLGLWFGGISLSVAIPDRHHDPPNIDVQVVMYPSLDTPLNCKDTCVDEIAKFTNGIYVPSDTWEKCFKAGEQVTSCSRRFVAAVEVEATAESLSSSSSNTKALDQSSFSIDANLKDYELDKAIVQFDKLNNACDSVKISVGSSTSPTATIKKNQSAVVPFPSGTKFPAAPITVKFVFSLRGKPCETRLTRFKLMATPIHVVGEVVHDPQTSIRFSVTNCQYRVDNSDYCDGGWSKGMSGEKVHPEALSYVRGNCPDFYTGHSKIVAKCLFFNVASTVCSGSNGSDRYFDMSDWSVFSSRSAIVSFEPEYAGKFSPRGYATYSFPNGDYYNLDRPRESCTFTELIEETEPMDILYEQSHAKIYNFTHPNENYGRFFKGFYDKTAMAYARPGFKYRAKSVYTKEQLTLKPYTDLMSLTKNQYTVYTRMEALNDHCGQFVQNLRCFSKADPNIIPTQCLNPEWLSNKCVYATRWDVEADWPARYDTDIDTQTFNLDFGLVTPVDAVSKVSIALDILHIPTSTQLRTKLVYVDHESNIYQDYYDFDLNSKMQRTDHYLRPGMTLLNMQIFATRGSIKRRYLSKPITYVEERRGRMDEDIATLTNFKITSVEASPEILGCAFPNGSSATLQQLTQWGSGKFTNCHLTAKFTYQYVYDRKHQCGQLLSIPISLPDELWATSGFRVLETSDIDSSLGRRGSALMSIQRQSLKTPEAKTILCHDIFERGVRLTPYNSFEDPSLVLALGPEQINSNITHVPLTIHMEYTRTGDTPTSVQEIDVRKLSPAKGEDPCAKICVSMAVEDCVKYVDDDCEVSDTYSVGLAVSNNMICAVDGKKWNAYHLTLFSNMVLGLTGTNPESSKGMIRFLYDKPPPEPTGSKSNEYFCNNPTYVQDFHTGSQTGGINMGTRTEIGMLVDSSLPDLSTARLVASISQFGLLSHVLNSFKFNVYVSSIIDSSMSCPSSAQILDGSPTIGKLIQTMRQEGFPGCELSVDVKTKFTLDNVDKFICSSLDDQILPIGIDLPAQANYPQLKTKGLLARVTSDGEPVDCTGGWISLSLDSVVESPQYHRAKASPRHHLDEEQCRRHPVHSSILIGHDPVSGSRPLTKKAFCKQLLTNLDSANRIDDLTSVSNTENVLIALDLKKCTKREKLKVELSLNDWKLLNKDATIDIDEFPLDPKWTNHYSYKSVPAPNSESQCKTLEKDSHGDGVMTFDQFVMNLPLKQTSIHCVATVSQEISIPVSTSSHRCSAEQYVVQLNPVRRYLDGRSLAIDKIDIYSIASEPTTCSSLLYAFVLPDSEYEHICDIDNSVTFKTIEFTPSAFVSIKNPEGQFTSRERRLVILKGNPYCSFNLDTIVLSSSIEVRGGLQVYDTFPMFQAQRPVLIRPNLCPETIDIVSKGNAIIQQAQTIKEVVDKSAARCWANYIFEVFYRTIGIKAAESSELVSDTNSSSIVTTAAVQIVKKDLANIPEAVVLRTISGDFDPSCQTVSLFVADAIQSEVESSKEGRAVQPSMTSLNTFDAKAALIKDAPLKDLNPDNPSSSRVVTINKSIPALNNQGWRMGLKFKPDNCMSTMAAVNNVNFQFYIHFSSKSQPKPAIAPYPSLVVPNDEKFRLELDQSFRSDPDCKPLFDLEDHDDIKSVKNAKEAFTRIGRTQLMQKCSGILHGILEFDKINTVSCAHRDPFLYVVMFDDTGDTLYTDDPDGHSKWHFSTVMFDNYPLARAEAVAEAILLPKDNNELSVCAVPKVQKSNWLVMKRDSANTGQYNFDQSLNIDAEHNRLGMRFAHSKTEGELEKDDSKKEFDPAASALQVPISIEFNGVKPSTFQPFKVSNLRMEHGSCKELKIVSDHDGVLQQVIEGFDLVHQRSDCIGKLLFSYDDETGGAKCLRSDQTKNAIDINFDPAVIRNEEPFTHVDSISFSFLKIIPKGVNGKLYQVGNGARCTDARSGMLITQTTNLLQGTEFKATFHPPLKISQEYPGIFLEFRKSDDNNNDDNDSYQMLGQTSLMKTKVALSVDVQGKKPIELPKNIAFKNFTRYIEHTQPACAGSLLEGVPKLENLSKIRKPEGVTQLIIDEQQISKHCAGSIEGVTENIVRCPAADGPADVAHMLGYAQLLTENTFRYPTNTTALNITGLLLRQRHQDSFLTYSQPLVGETQDEILDDLARRFKSTTTTTTTPAPWPCERVKIGVQCSPPAIDTSGYCRESVALNPECAGIGETVRLPNTDAEGNTFFIVRFQRPVLVPVNQERLMVYGTAEANNEGRKCTWDDLALTIAYRDFQGLKPDPITTTTTTDTPTVLTQVTDHLNVIIRSGAAGFTLEPTKALLLLLLIFVGLFR